LLLGEAEEFAMAKTDGKGGRNEQRPEREKRRPKHPENPERQAQDRKRLGKHYANKYRTGRG
jgi:hypothetical protein